MFHKVLPDSLNKIFTLTQTLFLRSIYFPLTLFSIFISHNFNILNNVSNLKWKIIMVRREYLITTCIFVSVDPSIKVESNILTFSFHFSAIRTHTLKTLYPGAEPAHIGFGFSPSNYLRENKLALSTTPPQLLNIFEQN